MTVTSHIYKKGRISPTKTIAFFFFLFRAPPEAYGCSQARSRIGATAAGLHHSHNMGSELCLQPTPQLTAMLDS